jgi:erythronate-4-phosphate dehydrogenase
VIDCWEGEPVIDRELMELAEIATFHIAGYSVEGKQRATRMAVEAIADFFGFTPDMSGLEGPYIHKTSLDKEKIMRDFDPYKLTERLRKAPELFDISRARYELRPES